MQGTLDDAGQVHARLVERGLTLRKRRAVVREVDDHRVLVRARFPEDLHEPPDPAVQAGHRLVVLGELCPYLGCVAQKWGHLDPVIVEHGLLVPGEGPVRVAEPVRLAGVALQDTLAAMRVHRAPVQEERAAAADEIAAGFGHAHVVPPVDVDIPEELVELEHVLRGHVVLPDARGAVAGFLEHDRETLDVVETREMEDAVRQAVHGVGVVVQAGQDHRTARRACGAGAEGVREPHAVRRERVHVRRDGRRVPVTACL